MLMIISKLISLLVSDKDAELNTVIIVYISGLPEYCGVITEQFRRNDNNNNSTTKNASWPKLLARVMMIWMMRRYRLAHGFTINKP